MSDPHSVLLLSQHAIKAGPQPVTRRRDWVLPVKERDSLLKLSAVLAQLKRRERRQWMLGWFYGCGVGGHLMAVLTGAC
jgi:hypothetical protein